MIYYNKNLLLKSSPGKKVEFCWIRKMEVLAMGLYPKYLGILIITYGHFTPIAFWSLISAFPVITVYLFPVEKTKRFSKMARTKISGPKK